MFKCGTINYGGPNFSVSVSIRCQKSMTTIMIILFELCHPTHSQTDAQRNKKELDGVEMCISILDVYLAQVTHQVLTFLKIIFLLKLLTINVK